MFRAFNLSSKYGRSKAEKILLTYQTFAISVKVPTPYTTQPPCHNCVAILGVYAKYQDSSFSGSPDILFTRFFIHSRERGTTPEPQDWWRKKKIRVRLFFMYMPHIKFQDSSISGSRVSQLPSITDRQTDGQTDRPKPICPLNFSEVGGIKMISELSLLPFLIWSSKYKFWNQKIYIRYQ